MESMESLSQPLNQSRENVQPVRIISQLMQSAASMYHMDELFLWMANTFVQQLGVSAVQFWVTQAYMGGKYHIELRSVASQNPSLSQDTYTNPWITALVKRMFTERRGMTSVDIAHVLTPYQANTFTRYNLHHWTSSFLETRELLPLTEHESSQEKIPTPLNMVVSFFTQQPPEQHQLRAVSFILDQSLRIAISRKLLTSTWQPLSAEPPIQQQLARLVPQQIHNAKIEQSRNPFADAVVIAEKKARQLYFLIDGYRNVTELMQLMCFSQKEIAETLQFLFQQHYIHLYEPGGQLVDPTLSIQSALKQR